jgi:serine/threonine protein kinase
VIGTVVGNYKVVEKIGEGGMGAVYKGVDLMLEREVAIKVLKPELASQPQVVERFRSEAVTLAKLNHPNIATLFSFFRQGDNFFMVLEFVNGIPLEKIIEAHGVMTCEQAIPLFCQMLEGIEHAHSFGIIHRDIKPANMMLTQNGLLKVLDFGIARALGSARMTRAGHLIGTIEYMSPEQVRGMDTDARSDIYSLGMVLYEMLTGRVPFASDSEFELMKAQVEQLPTPPREFAPSIPEQVEWAILCATEKDPEKRFQTAGAFGGAIVDGVTTAMATGELSQIEMRGSSSRLSAAVVGRDVLTSRVSGSSSAGFSQSSISTETQRVSSETETFPPPTRFAPTANEVHTTTGSMKATRLGTSSEFQSDMINAVSGTLTQQSSFLGKLNRKHYVLGGAALGLFFLGILTISLALFLRGTSTAENTESPTTSASSASPSVTPFANAEQTEQTVSPQDQPDANRLPDRAPVEENRKVDAALSNGVSVPAAQSQKPNQASRNSAAARGKARRRALAQQALDK